MHSAVRDLRLPLTLEHAARLEQARGTVLSCLEGCAWITIDGDPRDVILDAGDSMSIDSDQPVTAHALRPGARMTLSLRAAGRPPGGAGLGRRAGGLIDGLRALFGPGRPATGAA